MPTLVRCALVVEVAGRPLPADKGAKEVGLQIADLGSGVPLVRVLGKKREIQLASRDVQQVLVHAVDKGRLALVTKTGMKIMLSEAQPSQLEFVVRSLKESEANTKAVLASRSERTAQPGSLVGRASSSMHGTPAQRRHLLAGTATPMKAMRTGASAQEDKTCSVRNDVLPSSVMNKLVSMVSSTVVLAGFYASSKLIKDFVREWHAHRILCGIWHAPDHILENVLSYHSCAITLARLSETCKQLESFVLRRRTELHLRAPQRSGIPTELLLQRVVRHPTLSVLDLSGYTDLRAPATVGLAKVLGQGAESGEGIRTLRLRGCKYLTDVAVQRLILHCPHLEVLDILEIPRLSNRALDAPLSTLRIIVAGSLGVRVVAEKGKATLLPSGSVSALDAGDLMQAQRGTTSSQLFTSKVLSRFAISPSLTHAILPNCSEFEILPQLPRTIQHLDLRCANLQIPSAVVDSWKPFAVCEQLTTLILSGNTFLSSAALLASLRSIPSGQMKVLDLSGTRAEPPLFADLPAFQGSLTHLRVAQCMAFGNVCFVDILRGLPRLEVLDVSGCRMLERPLSDMVVLAADGVAHAAAGANAPNLRKLGVGQTELATYLDSTRRSLRLVAPSAEVLNGSLELFDGYKNLPPKLL